MREEYTVISVRFPVSGWFVNTLIDGLGGMSFTLAAITAGSASKALSTEAKAHFERNWRGTVWGLGNIVSRLGLPAAMSCLFFANVTISLSLAVIFMLVGQRGTGSYHARKQR